MNKKMLKIKLGLLIGIILSITVVFLSAYFYNRQDFIKFRHSITGLSEVEIINKFFSYNFSGNEQIGLDLYIPDLLDSSLAGGTLLAEITMPQEQLESFISTEKSTAPTISSDFDSTINSYVGKPPEQIRENFDYWFFNLSSVSRKYVSWFHLSYVITSRMAETYIMKPKNGMVTIYTRAQQITWND